MSATGGAPVRAVLFDADGTLIRPREPVGRTYARRARVHGVELPADRLEEAFRRVLRAAPPMRFPDVARARVPELERAWWRERVRATFRAADSTVRFADFDACFDELFAHFAEPGAWETCPGAVAALAALRGEGRRLAVVSNFDHRLPKILAGLDLTRWLDAVLLPCETGRAKPDPELFREACRRLQATPTEAVFVGDDPAHDLAAARAAGLRAIDVRGLATLEALPARIHALEKETA